MLVLTLLLAAVPFPFQGVREARAESQALGLATAGTLGFPQLELMGAPVLGRPFGVAITGGTPGAPGLLLLGDDARAQPLPEYGAVLYPSGALASEAFLLDASGASGALAAVAPVPVELWGEALVAQALLADPRAQGGVAVTRAARVRFGSIEEQPLFAGPLLDLGTAWLPTSFTYSQGVQEIDSGDFDSDGNTDVVITVNESGGARAMVCFGSPGGLSSPPLEVKIPRATGVASADFDGDGAHDFVVANAFRQGPVSPFPGQVSVALSRGDRTFQPLLVTQVGIEARTVLAGDLDGDGDADVLVQDESASAGRQLLGNGDGTFAKALFSPPYALRSFVDMDLDGALDIVGQTASEVVIARGTGDGAFQTPLASPAGGSPFVLDVGSLDADGIPDVGVAFQDTVAVLSGTGSGTFSAPIPHPSAGSAARVALGDVDGDGLDDLVTLGAGARVFRAMGGGSLSAARVFAVRGSPHAGLVADLDRNGRGDVVVAQERISSAGAEAELYLLLGTSDGLLSAAVPSALGGSFSAMAVADLDGDSQHDLVLGGNGALFFASGSGDGTFAPGHSIAGNSRGRLATADLDRDHDQDVVYADSVRDAVKVVLGDGSGGFGATTTFAAVDGAWCPIVADLDVDGFLDVAALGASSGDELALLYGRGDGTFDPAVVLNVGQDPYSLTVDDFTGDDVPDLAVGHPARIEIWQGSTARHFTFLDQVDLPGIPRFLVASDLDRDGDSDLVATIVVLFPKESAAALVFAGLGNGSLSLESSVTLTEWLPPTEIVVADLDRDLHLDLAIGTRVGVEMLRGLGNLDFEEPRRFLTSTLGPQALAAADIDEDFLPDLIALDDPSGTVVRVLTSRLLHAEPRAIHHGGPVSTRGAAAGR